jgi:hypothetical protein
VLYSQIKLKHKQKQPIGQKINDGYEYSFDSTRNKKLLCFQTGKV